MVSGVWLLGTNCGYVWDMQAIYWAKSHKSSIYKPLRSRTLSGAKREAWAWITEQYCGVTVLIASTCLDYLPVASKSVCPITGKTKKWKEV